MDSDDRMQEIGCEVSDRDEHDNGLRINPKHIEGPGNGNGNAWSSSFLMRSTSISTSTSTLSTPRSRQGSPRSPSPTTFSSSPFRDIAPLKTAFQSRLSNAYSFSSSSSASPKHQVKKGWANFLYETKKSRLQSPKAELQESAASTTRRRQRRRRVRGVIFIVLGLLAAFFLLDWWVLSRLQDDHHQPHHLLLHEDPQFPDKSRRLQGGWSKFAKGKRPPRVMYDRLLALAAHALAEGESKPEPKELWEEPFVQASAWKPCADKRKLDFRGV